MVVATDAHFEWACRRQEHERFEGLRAAPGGVEPPAVLTWIRRTAAETSAVLGHPAAWFIVVGDEVIGSISFKGLPTDGAVEIGYGVAEGLRSRGHATRAVALVCDAASSLGLAVVAETAADNRASQRVLERNGFVRCGEREDPEEGVLVRFRREPDPSRPRPTPEPVQP